MEEQRTQRTQLRQRRRTGSGAGPGSGPDPYGSSGSTLLAQAEGWGEVAREAHADCVHGAEAEAELERRRNQSGQ